MAELNGAIKSRLSQVARDISLIGNYVRQLVHDTPGTLLFGEDSPVPPAGPGGAGPAGAGEVIDAEGAPAGAAPFPFGSGNAADVSGNAGLPLKPAPGAGAPAPELNPADVERFKALARQVLAADGVPADQIEARLDAVVADTQQWIADGMPHYVPPPPARPPAPGFGEGFADRWFATEQAIKNLLGQGGPGAPAVWQAWEQLGKGIAEVAVNPVGAVIGEVKTALDSPSAAYYRLLRETQGGTAHLRYGKRT